jgi:myo-inositol-1(or 4)-monophosphatase
MEFTPQYKSVIDYILSSGKRLTSKAGNIQDIGITKADLTEEDLTIERGFKKLIEDFKGDHILFAEEENTEMLDGENVWVVDPISGTNTFIKGLGHYGIVAAHMHHGQVNFAAVYDPSVNELFTAFRGKGAYLNGKLIKVSDVSKKSPTIVFNRSSAWKKTDVAEKLWVRLDQLGRIYRNTNSFAVNYCHVACGRYDGIITLSKDTFPEFAGSLILSEAEGKFTNNKGEENFTHDDRIFIGGNESTYKNLSLLLKTINV